MQIYLYHKNYIYSNKYNKFELKHNITTIESHNSYDAIHLLWMEIIQVHSMNDHLF